MTDRPLEMHTLVLTRDMPKVGVVAVEQLLGWTRWRLMGRVWFCLPESDPLNLFEYRPGLNGEPDHYKASATIDHLLRIVLQTPAPKRKGEPDGYLEAVKTKDARDFVAAHRQACALARRFAKHWQELPDEQFSKTITEIHRRYRHVKEAATRDPQNRRNHDEIIALAGWLPEDVLESELGEPLDSILGGRYRLVRRSETSGEGPPPQG